MTSRGWIQEELFKQFRMCMPIASVDILSIYKDKLLLMLRNNEPGRNQWFVPGGRVQYGETLKQAALRKLYEETGLNARNIKKMGVMSHFWPQAHYISTFYRIDVNNDYIKLNDEHRDYKWISKITDDLHPYIKQMSMEANIFNTKN